MPLPGGWSALLVSKECASNTYAMRLHAWQPRPCNMRRKFIVEQSTGCSDPVLLESLYEHYAQPEAWTLCPDAAASLASISAAGEAFI